MTAMRFGIFGGTFNPIHLGHLLLAQTAREALALDRVLFVPTRQPPHKRARNLLPGAERLTLIGLAIRDEPAFVASEIELQRSGTSYSIDTVRTLRQQLPKAVLFLLIGEDMLSVRWAAWDELKRLCTVVVAHRQGADACGERAKRVEPRREAGLKWLDMPQVGIASADIRARLKAGRSIRYLVPAAVERYIRQQHLYARGGVG